MFKLFALTLLALHCHCADIVELNGGKLIRTDHTHLPLLKTVGGISSLPLHSSYLSSHLSSLPLSYGQYGLNHYGLGLNGLSGLSGYSGLSGLTGLRSYGLHDGLGLGVSDLRSHVLAPQVLNYGLGLQKNVLAVRHQPALAQYALAQPALAVAQPHLAIHQKSVIAAPQVYATEAVRPVNAAIQQIGRTVEYRPLPYSEQPILPQEVVVEPSDQPINIHFRSRSSTVRISQEHIPGEPGTVEQTQSQDDPSKVIHEVVKPVIQEVREVIQPYRQVTQEVQPVVENVHTVVSEGHGQRAQYVAPHVQRYAVPHIKQLSVAVAQPALAQVAVAQPALAQIEVAQPALEVSQPAVARVAVAQPYGIALAQPQLRYQAVNIAPRLQEVQGIQYQDIQNLQPIRTSIIRTPQLTHIAQPHIGVSRYLSVDQPIHINRQGDNRQFRSEVRSELRSDGYQHQQQHHQQVRQ